MINAKERFSAYLHRRYSDRSTPENYLNDFLYRTLQADILIKE